MQQKIKDIRAERILEFEREIAVKPTSMDPRLQEVEDLFNPKEEKTDEMLRDLTGETSESEDEEDQTVRVRNGFIKRNQNIAPNYHLYQSEKQKVLQLLHRNNHARAVSKKEELERQHLVQKVRYVNRWVNYRLRRELEFQVKLKKRDQRCLIGFWVGIVNC